MPIFTTAIQHSTGSLARDIREEKEIKSPKLKGKTKTISICN